jgi:DeoR family transcriptional regulator, ulaG and ulaABCDEF operon transcriptional repressor
MLATRKRLRVSLCVVRFLREVQLLTVDEEQGPSGSVVCRLDQADIVITDGAITSQHRRMLSGAGVRLMVV